MCSENMVCCEGSLSPRGDRIGQKKTLILMSGNLGLPVLSFTSFMTYGKSVHFLSHFTYLETAPNASKLTSGKVCPIFPLKIFHCSLEQNTKSLVTKQSHQMKKYLIKSYNLSCKVMVQFGNSFFCKVLIYYCQ